MYSLNMRLALTGMSRFLAATLFGCAAIAAQAQQSQRDDRQAIEDCLEMGTQRAGKPGDDPLADVEIAAYSFRMEMVHDAAAMCSLARRLRPQDRKVAEAYELSMKMLRLLVFGINGPSDSERAFSQAFVLASTDRSLPGKLAKFYLGLAFEYGVGTKPDRLAAIHWYKQASDTGDMIAQREQARLEAAK